MRDTECNSSGQKVLPSEILSQNQCYLFIYFCHKTPFDVEGPKDYDSEFVFFPVLAEIWPFKITERILVLN